MCGIFGYSGKREAAPILLQGIKTLEYRGYDSAGVYVHGHKPIKAVGEVENVIKKYNKDTRVGTAGIAHTRWATHGIPHLKNTHPHTDCSGNLQLVHNGIIENYQELKKELLKAGHTFSSDTDTEVLVHLIEDTYKNSTKESFQEAVISSLKKVSGTYGVAVMHKDFPNEIFVARMGSPIVLGIGDDAHYVASDPSAILKHTNNMLYLEDGECAVITPTTYSVFSLSSQVIDKKPEEIEGEVADVQKEGFDHFMKKEIFEARDVLQATLRGRLSRAEGTAVLGGIYDIKDYLLEAKRIVIVACGSAYYAGLVGKYMLEEYADIHVDVEVASEYRYKTAPREKGTILLAISQSGETADTLACIKEAKRKGMLTLGIVNAVGSTIARETDAGVYNHAGPEISVASTKAFLSQMVVLVLLTLYIGRGRHMGMAEGKRIIDELLKLPASFDEIFDMEPHTEIVAKKYAQNRDFLFLGRKYNFPLAYEGALKLKEISYIHAEGYGAGEMKHGPLAMIDKNFPTFAICTDDSVYEKNISNIEEICARKGPIVALGHKDDLLLASLATDIIGVPKTIEMLQPLLNVIPLQLFAYHVSVAKGLNVDRPRNLAKSVTVE